MTLPITIAIATFHREALLAEALASLAVQTVGRELDVIVVDNGSSDATAAVADAWSGRLDKLRYVREAERGLSAARNRALLLTQTPLIAYLDDDAIAEAEWAEALMASFAQLSPGVAAMGGKILPRWGGPKPPWLGPELEGYYTVLDLGQETRMVSPSGVYGANMAFRTAALRSVSGFSRRLGRRGHDLVGSEELGACLALERAGYAIAYCGAARVRHFVAAERLTEDWILSRVAAQGRSDAVLYGRVAPDVRTLVRIVRTAVRELRSGGGGEMLRRTRYAYLTGFLRGLFVLR